VKVEEEGEEEGEEEEGEAKVLHSIHDGGARWHSITRGVEWTGKTQFPRWDKTSVPGEEPPLVLVTVTWWIPGWADAARICSNPPYYCLMANGVIGRSRSVPGAAKTV
jgi:hypothetical protein